MVWVGKFVDVAVIDGGKRVAWTITMELDILSLFADELETSTDGIYPGKQPTRGLAEGSRCGV